MIRGGQYTTEGRMAFVNFAELKARLTIEQVARDFLGLNLTKSGNQLRGMCPVCEGDKRGLAITPDKGLFHCFSAGKGGDLISLAAHIRKESMRDVAVAIEGHFPAQAASKPRALAEAPAPAAPPQPRQEASTGALKPLDYLTTDHPAIEALGLSAAACEAIGIGYAPRGTMVKRVLIPLRLPDGTLAGYMGIATAIDQTPLLLFPKNLDEKCAVEPPKAEEPKQSADEMRRMFRVV